MAQGRTVRTALTTAVAAAVLLGGCSAPPPAADSAPPPTAEEAAPAVEVVSTEQLIADGELVEPALDTARSAALGVVPSDRTTTDPYGEFTPVTLADDAPILGYDPATAPAEVREAFSDEYLRTSVAAGARFFVEDWLDSPLRWDDRRETWLGWRDRLGGVWPDAPLEELPTSVSGDPNLALDVGSWREEQGLAPAPYVLGEPRLAVDGLAVTAVVADEREGRPGVSVTYGADIRSVVVDQAGTPFGMSEATQLTLVFSPDYWRYSWSASWTVGNQVRGGYASLPRLVTEEETPEDWAPLAVADLEFSMPPGHRVAAESEPGAASPWRQWQAATVPDQGREGQRKVYASYRPSEGEPPEGTWRARRGFDNHGLDVPGAVRAAAETGPDEQGRPTAYVDITTNAGQYHLEWYLDPSQEPVDEVRRVASTLVLAGA